MFPLLTVAALGFESEPIKLTILFAAKFEAVDLELHKGYITKVNGGFCSLSATLKFGQVAFPTGLAPIKWQLSDGHRFNPPGIAVLVVDQPPVPQPS